MTAGLSHLPREAQLYLARGLLYGELAQYDKAEADFGTAASLDPSIPAFSFTATDIPATILLNVRQRSTAYGR